MYGGEKTHSEYHARCNFMQFQMRFSPAQYNSQQLSWGHNSRLASRTNQITLCEPRAMHIQIRICPVLCTFTSIGYDRTRNWQIVHRLCASSFRGTREPVLYTLRFSVFLNVANFFHRHPCKWPAKNFRGFCERIRHRTHSRLWK